MEEEKPVWQNLHGHRTNHIPDRRKRKCEKSVPKSQGKRPRAGMPLGSERVKGMKKALVQAIYSKTSSLPQIEMTTLLETTTAVVHQLE